MLRKEILIVTVVAIAQLVSGTGFAWSPCSKSCGQGTKSRKCRPNEIPACSFRYEDCVKTNCPQIKCQTYKYHSLSECCQPAPANVCGVAKHSSKRIIGGSKSVSGEWPWHVAIRKVKAKEAIGGGALINEYWVVTAGHVIVDTGVTADQIEVLAGTTKIVGANLGQQSALVTKVIVHPNYADWLNDIAVILLQKPLRYSDYVSPICLPMGEVVEQDVTCYVAGWGLADNANRTARRASNDLLHVGVRVVPIDACEQAYKNEASSIGVNDNALCAGILGGGKDTCNGDSGGPLVCQRKGSCQWYLAGAVSFGARTCGAAEWPGVYADMTKYESWIEDQIKVYFCKNKNQIKNGEKCTDNITGLKCACTSPEAERERQRIYDEAWKRLMGTLSQLGISLVPAT